MMRLLLWFSLASAGCMTGVYAARTGRPYPPNRPDCQLRFDYFDRKSQLDLLANYQNVGGITLYHLPLEFHWTWELQEKVRSEACRLGGDAVVFQSTETTEGIGLGAIGNFAVYRKLEGSQ